MAKQNNPYYNPPTKPIINPDKVIIPAWVLVSFFEDYGITEIELFRDENPDVLKIVMLKDGRRLKTHSLSAK
jgi:hypothetical protein